jgi:hypothetical protein
MEQSQIYGQMDFNLPHDVVNLPSKGIFYKPKKESLKVGYLTANDENLLMSQNTPKEGIVVSLLKNKIYEPGFDVTQLIDVDVQAILIFLRNTAFGPEYNFKLKDPANGNEFDTALLIDEINYLGATHSPNEDGFFKTTLPKSNSSVTCKILNLREENIIQEIQNNYPKNMVAPTITKRIEMQIVELNGDSNREKISKFVNQMPIQDSKHLRKFLRECEPKLDLIKTISAPSGEKVIVEITFGVEFFRPFFSI